VLTALHCALRRSELAALDASDLRMVGRYWTLEIRPRPGQGSSAANESRENGHARASVKVPAHVADALDALRKAWGRHGAMFRSLSNRNRGARLTPDAIYKIVKEAGAQAGLEDVTPETLRQTGLQLAVDAGAPLRQVQAHARHAGAEPTARRADPGTRLGDSAADYIQVGN
jgi:integrase